MAKSPPTGSNDSPDSALKTSSEERLKSYLSGMEELAAARRPLAEALERDRTLEDHIARASAVSAKRGDAIKAATLGKSTFARARRSTGKEWASVFSEASRSALAQAYDKAGGARGGETAWLNRAFELPEGPLREWTGRYGDLGWTHLIPLDPPDDDTGTIQQGLGDPITSCVGPPYAFFDTASSATGLAYMTVSPSATPSSGRVFLMSTTVAPVAAGGGTDSIALVGSDLAWPAGFDTLNVTAAISLTISSLFAVAILGGASASAEMVLRVEMSDGRVFRTGVGLGSAVAPLLWHTSISQSGQRTVRSGPIPLNGKAGTARLMAGLHDNTAAVGVVGSSGGDSFQGANITSICATVA